MDYFKRLQTLLAIEQEGDKQAWLQTALSTTVAQRRNTGLAWYPIAIRNTELNRAEYLSVEVERTTHTDVVHQLRPGMPAMLFSNHDPKNDFIEGTIVWVNGNRLRLQLRTEELPDWADDGKLGIDLQFDDNSYDEMHTALRTAATLHEQPKEGRLIRVLTGNAQPEALDDAPHYTSNTLNESQQTAVNKMLQARDVAVVHGPPGTGKTTTIVQGIKEMVARGSSRILVTAPSNAAVDLLCERLSAEGLNVLRVGNPARVSERLMALKLDSRIAEHNTIREIKRLKKQAAEFRDMAHKYKRQFGRAEREQRKAIFAEAHKIMKDVGRMEQYITDDILAHTQVVAATLVGAAHYTVRHLQYDAVVIDEAGQAIEPACWIPILKAPKVILAGDHCQLPPTIKSDEAARGGLSTTLMEKCTQLHPQWVSMLQVQYRMHQAIMGYSSRMFYNNALQAHHSVAGHTLPAANAPLVFIDTAGCGFEEREDDKSISNPEEAVLLYRHLVATLAELKPHLPVGQYPSVAVIAPYRQQLQVLQEQLIHMPDLQPWLPHIAVNTIDSFQGQERDIVYISMTRSNSDNIIGFLSDIRRMNVAMTRARKKLVVIGDSATLSVHPFYDGFITQVQEQGGWQSAWEVGWE